MNSINPELLQILACPACKTKVVLKGEHILCTNPSCALQFPIRDGIPVMIIEEAKKSR